MNKPYKSRGFTIVELLIVIIVIGILATLVLVAYNNVQKQARETKMRHDITTMMDAIRLARSNTGQTLAQITGTYQTASDCIAKATGTNLATLPKTDACWVSYMNALVKIGTASNTDIRNFTDPWGRPYLIDENEMEFQLSGPYAGQQTCYFDTIGTYSYPFHTGWVDALYPLSGDVFGPNNLQPSGFTKCSAGENGGTGMV